jgi:hypothetical protein
LARSAFAMTVLLSPSQRALATSMRTTRVRGPPLSGD